jgi:hypothetical protein
MGKIMILYSVGSTGIGLAMGVMGFSLGSIIVASMVGAPGLHLLWLIAKARGMVGLPQIPRIFWTPLSCFATLRAYIIFFYPNLREATYDTGTAS